MLIIEKILSANDTGETGAHQAGMLIPKSGGVLTFFPVLDESLKNPRARITVSDEFENEWCFVFIYYNNRFHGGTRNEYRLTGMTSFIKENSLRKGDSIRLTKGERNRIRISCVRASKSVRVLTLSSSWKVVPLTP